MKEKDQNIINSFFEKIIQNNVFQICYDLKRNEESIKQCDNLTV